MRVYTYIYTLDAAELHKLTAMLQEGGLHVYADPGLDWLLEYASTLTVQLIVLSLAHEVAGIMLDEGIELRAREFLKFDIKPLDALHLASAEAANADDFCTCDDRFLRVKRQSTI